MSDLVMLSAEKHLTIYNQMCGAIDACHRVDECKNIADKSVALAAYYKQIKDDATVRMFNEVRLRAWRRIGKLFATVDMSGCDSQTARIRTIRAAFDDEVMAGISDSRIREILLLSDISDADFESAFEYDLSGSIPDLIYHTPSHLEMLRKRRQEEAAAAARPRDPAEIAREAALALKREALNERTKRYMEELAEASTMAMKEVGLTLERKDRANMKQVVFLIKENIHGIMRQAAFDQKVTMQEILRRGLKMWLLAHGYNLPED